MINSNTAIFSCAHTVQFFLVDFRISIGRPPQQGDNDESCDEPFQTLGASVSHWLIYFFHNSFGHLTETIQWVQWSQIDI